MIGMFGWSYPPGVSDRDIDTLYSDDMPRCPHCGRFVSPRTMKCLQCDNTSENVKKEVKQ